MKKVIVFTFYLLTSILFGQDRHYWMNMGGSRSGLLGGIVIGGVRDNSSSYYNPAGLAFLLKNSHSISSDAYQLQNITIENGAGYQLNLKSNQTVQIPTLASGTFQHSIIPGLRLGYVIAAREFTTIKASARYESVVDVIPTVENGLYIGDGKFINLFEGEEEYSGQYLFDENLNELWAGLSWGTFLSENIAFGITWFVAIRNHSQTKNTNVFAVDNYSLKVASNQVLETIEYWNVRTFPKIGFQFELLPIRLGITFTAPSIYITGQGTVAGILTSRNVLRAADLNSDKRLLVEIVGTDRQQDLKANYKTPPTIGFGIEYNPTELTSLNIGAEYFFSKREYTVVQPKSKLFFKGETETEESLIEYNSADILRIVDAKRDILNFGIGIEQKITNEFSGYISARTDFRNNLDKNFNGLTAGITEWDIYHFSIGALYRAENQEIAFAFTGSYGSDDNYEQFVNFPDATKSIDEALIIGKTRSTKARYWELGVLLGFTYYLSD